MNDKWTPLKIGDEIPLLGKYIVTRALKGCNGKKFFDTTLGFPGWSYSNNYVTAYMGVKSAVEDKSGWHSIYWGDDPPKTRGWYLVTMIRTNSNRARLGELFYEPKKARWLAVPENWEVVAYKPFPKPYNGKTAIFE